MKKKLLLVIVLSLYIAGSVFAQIDINANTYTFSRSGFAPATLSAPIQLIGASSDNVASAVTDIGFTFWFAGVAYTQFSVSENGLLTLGSTQISGTDITNDMASAVTLPKIAAYWDDLATGTDGFVQYQVIGTAPNRILHVNWKVTVPKNVNGASNSLIQAQLSETSGNITFTYGTPAIPANANQYTIGIGKAVNDFASVTPTSATAGTVAYGTSSNLNTITPGQYTRYNFFTDKAAPSITATPLIPNTPGTANRTVTRTIGDTKTGVPVAGSFVPRIYFKKGIAGTWFSTAGVIQSGNGTSGSWLFTVDHSLMGGVTDGDIVYYYIIAQDQALTTGVPNIASHPAGVVATDVNTVTTPPATPSYYIIGPSLSGIKTVGTGGDYASLTLAGGAFEQINSGQLTGNLTLQIISDLTGEIGTVALNGWINAAGGPYTLSIVPSGIRTVTGSNIIRLSGTQGVLIDGLNDGTNSLTFDNNGGGGFTLQSGASNNTITRCTIKGYSASGSAIILFNNNTATPCNNNIISYCNITSSNILSVAYQAILYSGTTSTGTGNVVDHNKFTNLGYFAVHKAYNTTSLYNNFTISNNEVYNTQPVSERNYFQAFCLEGTSGTSNIFNNVIHDLHVSYNTLAGSGVTAISVPNALNDVTNVYNNVIYLETSVNNPLQAYYAINATNAGTANIYYNSIHIAGSSTNAAIARGISKTGTGNANIRNNVVYISRTGSTNTPIYVTGANSQSNNFTGNPGFTSPTNLLPDITNPNAANLDNMGIPVSGITTDILGISRNATTPDIGAYEFTIPYKSLTLNLFLEGLYAGAGAMTQAFDQNGPHWPAGVADHVKIELHDAAAYSTIVYTINDVVLSTAGALNIPNIPNNLSGDYFITVKHRNSVETTTPTAISFAGAAISHDFTTSASQAYGSNLKNVSGVFLIYTGDVNQDGSVDTGDMIPIDNDSFTYSSGYLVSDVNGDGIIDTGDMMFVDNNSSNYIGTMHP